MKAHVATSLALFFLCLCPGRAQSFDALVIGGPFVYGAAYIDIGGINTSFDLDYLTTVDAPNDFGVAQYNEPWAVFSEFLRGGSTVAVHNVYDALSDCDYTATGSGLTWSTPGCPDMTFLGSSGPITWTTTGDLLQIDIDLGMGQGVNFSYATPNGLNWTGAGAMVINGTPWLVTGSVNFTAAETGIGHLDFTVVPEPGMAGLALGGLALLGVRLRRK